MAFQFQFDWDPIKARRNGKKHGVTFDRAATIFLDPQALSQFDDEHSADEERWITLGLDAAGVLLVVCHSYKEEKGGRATIRIISARKATRSEGVQYSEDQSR